MGGQELEFIQDAFRENWIAPVGPQINQFEKELAEYVGSPHAVVLSSGTAAIHLALIILGIKQDDYVLCSSFTFSGTANPIKYCNANVVFIDSEKDSWNISPELLEQAIIDLDKKGKKPKALILVHLYGMPAKIEVIQAITKKYNIPVIEDAAEAIGSEYKKKGLGSFGDIGILSFNGNKIITTSGGGAFLSENEEYTKLAKHLSTQAREDFVHYEHTKVGYNYRMSNIVAAIGLGQLRTLNKHMERTREINRIYKEELGSYKVEFQQEWSRDCFSNYWLTTLLLESHELQTRIMQALEKDNIESRPLWKPMHLQPVFKDELAYVDGTSEHMFRTGLCLPSGSSLEEEDMERIIRIIKRIL
jgi:dTDP-4-amino-4,6-dideoxygalactose transaminase